MDWGACARAIPLGSMRISASATPHFFWISEALPAASRHQFTLWNRADLDATHRRAQTARDLGQDRRVLEVRRRLDDGLRHARRVVRLEDAGADEDAIAAEPHDQRRIRWGRHATRAEEHDRQPPQFAHLPYQF